MCMIKGFLKSVRLGPHILMKGWGLVKGTSKWCVVCIGDGMDIRFVVAHDKTNG
jgi:hypothetical protein